MLEVASIANLDHEALLENTLKTLNALAALKVSRSRISMISGGEVFVGGFGDVRQAKLRTTFWDGATIALKTLRPTGGRQQRIRVIASLARELHVWSKLKHKNILALHGFYFDEVSFLTAWIATPWQKNGNISAYVKAKRANQFIRLKLGLDAARGLAYLHNLSPPVCHGDIKPENTLVNDAGDAVLCDFGQAKILEDVPSGLTTMSTSACTLRYAAPELIRGDGSVHSLASDVWAWACLLFAMITDTLPYAERLREMAVRNAILRSESPADLAAFRIPDAVRTILTKCWTQDPESRPEIGWCGSELSQSVFRQLLQLPLSRVPPKFRSLGACWSVIHNPTMDKAYDIWFQDLQCAPLPLNRQFLDALPICSAKAGAIVALVYKSSVGIHVRDVKTRAFRHHIRVEGVALAGSPNHPFIVVTRDRDCAVLLDAERGRFFYLLGSSGAAAYTPDGRIIVTGCSGEGLWTLDLEPLFKARTLEVNEYDKLFAGGPEALGLTGTWLDGPQSSISSLSISSDGQLAVSASHDNTGVVLWNISDRRPVLKMGGGRLKQIKKVIFRPGSIVSKGALEFTYFSNVRWANGVAHYGLHP